MSPHSDLSRLAALLRAKLEAVGVESGFGARVEALTVHRFFELLAALPLSPADFFSELHPAEPAPGSTRGDGAPAETSGGDAADLQRLQELDPPLAELLATAPPAVAVGDAKAEAQRIRDALSRSLADDLPFASGPATLDPGPQLTVAEVYATLEGRRIPPELFFARLYGPPDAVLTGGLRWSQVSALAEDLVDRALDDGAPSAEALEDPDDTPS